MVRNLHELFPPMEIPTARYKSDFKYCEWLHSEEFQGGLGGLGRARFLHPQPPASPGSPIDQARGPSVLALLAQWLLLRALAESSAGGHMRSGTVSNEDRSTLSQIKNLMDRRRETYGRVFSRSLAIRRPDSGWTHALTRFDVLSNGAPAPQERRWEYEDAMLVTRGMSQAQLIESLEQLIERGELHLSDLPTFRVEGNFSWNELLPSRSPS